MAQLHTVAVTCTAHQQIGDPAVGALVSAQLQGNPVYQGFVLPELTQTKTNTNGVAIMNLWPNVLSSTPSYYKIKIIDVNGSGKSQVFYVVIPDQTCNLSELPQIDPTSDTWWTGTPNNPPFVAASITVGQTTTLAPNSGATVQNVGTPTQAVLDFGIPQGVKGDKGDPGLNGSGTMVVGTVTTLPYGSNAYVTNVGTPAQAVLNFGIPQGAPGSGTGGTGGTGGVLETYVPLYPWEGGVVSPTTDVTLDGATLTDYATAINGASLGSKRLAGANALITDFGASQLLTITRDGVQMLQASYGSPLVLFNDGTNIGVTLGSLSSVSTIAAGALSTGVWQATLSTAGTSHVITMSVGAVGSGKDLILSADTAAGDGFAASFTLIVPRSVDGL